MCGGDENPPSKSHPTPECLKPKPLNEAADGDLVVEDFPLVFEGKTYPHSRIAYIKGRRPCPVVLVHHNYAGLKQFDIDQACFLAKVGYVGLAVDLYQEKPEYTYADRNPIFDANTDEGQEIRRKHFIGAFGYMRELLAAPRHFRDLMSAYLDQAFKHSAVASGLAGCIGYCLGGQSCLEQLRAGHMLQAIVTFHGLLHSRPQHPDEPYNPKRRISKEEYLRDCNVPANTYTPNCVVVVENGDIDEHVPKDMIEEWVNEMNEHKVDWRFNNHSQTPHGWALGPGVTATSYQERADRRSTLSMLSTFAEVWPDFEQYEVEVNACGTALGQHISPARAKRQRPSSL